MVQALRFDADSIYQSRCVQWMGGTADTGALADANKRVGARFDPAKQGLGLGVGLCVALQAGADALRAVGACLKALWIPLCPIAALRELFGHPPTDEELSDERSRWVRTVMGYPEPLRQAVAANCDALSELADRSCPTPRTGQRWPHRQAWALAVVRGIYPIFGREPSYVRQGPMSAAGQERTLNHRIRS
jgi:hypothetical protein